ncbi:MAG: ABC transporter ATP-binding protein [Calothrix sp. C42_A2020_038]|nr:ABC transporter ATP-binding protein [Calothrix sp. C42_A2020_038]
MIKSFQQMISASGSYAPELKLSLLLSIIASTTQGIIFALFFPLFSALMSSPIDIPRVWTLVALMAFLVIIEFLIRWRELEFGWIITIDAASEMRLKLGEQLRKMPLEELSRRRSGDLNVILSGNVTDSLLSIGTIASIIIKTMVVPTIVIIVTFFIDWRLATVMLLTFPLAVPFYRWQKAITSKATRDVAIADANTASRIIEYAQGMPVLRATQQVGQQSQRLHQAINEQRQIQTQATSLGTAPAILMSTIVEIGIIFIIALSTLLVLQSSISIPQVFALAVVATRFSEPIAIFGELTAVFNLMKAALERIEALMAIKPLPVNTTPTTLSKFDITFENVDFAYADQKESILNNISFHLPEKSLTALVGSSGSGKTTITRLISRFADVKSGSIKIGGADIRDVEPVELMKHISVVFQDVYLFDDTILNNIRLAKPNATDAEVETAARAANCHEFVSRLPNGYNTKVGEIGGALSGGERQRISIARAILKDAPIVILDEPTSALDTESEVAVQAAIDKLVENKTVVVIAHRLSTVIGADKILVLEAGQIIESGNHEELLSQNRRYAMLWNAQQQSRRWKITA